MDVSGIGSSMVSSASKNAQSVADKLKDDEFQKKLKSAMDSKDETALKKVSKDLESVFVDMMFKEMRKTINTSGLTEDAPGKDIFESMFDQKVSESLSKGNGIGLADMIYKQVMQEMKNRVKIDDENK